MGIYADHEKRLFADLSSKATPVAGDSLVISDSEDSSQPKKITIGDLPAQDGADSTAIHVDAEGEIADLDAKAAPVLADLLLIEDTEDSDAKAKITIGQVTGVAGQVSNLDTATPLITDTFAFEDQSDSDSMKGATIQEIFAAPGWMSGVAAATPLAADVVVFEDASDSLAIKKATVGELPVAQAQVRGILLRPAADAAVTILGTTRAIEITVTAAATVVIATDPSCYRGQVVDIRAKSVAGGGSYTLEVDPGGVNLTIDATGEAPRIIRSETDTWVVIGLEGATIV